MISKTEKSDMSRALSTVTIGFAGDPIMRWLFPEPNDFLTNFPDVVRLFGGGAFEHGGAFHAQDFTGAALWLPPGAHPDGDGLVALFEERLSGQVKDEIFALFEQMDACHPTVPCWHLAFVAVDPLRQGKGHGSALVAEGLRLCDEAHEPAYLESTNIANLGLYQRHGFEVVGHIQAGDSPPIIPMLREPR